VALNLIAWDDSAKRPKRTPQVSAVSRSQSAALSSATTSVSVTYSSVMPSTSYALIATMQNVTDTTPLIQPVVITYQDTSGFIAKWNYPLDSSNYVLNYVAMAFT
jgi:hypothetical protein